ncbi:hypothetical protein [uncultured Phycicoccus sp.]|uniref:hypothetical protein n=1 Tax=uncultured Phycicoccus sp. TaxID=661422 RepID=UPI002630B6D5|nr:hypothetical protein [uncultured Phycicoccus sp.]
MEPYREALTAGGHTNSLGRAGEVLADVQGDRARLPELFACISDPDAWVRMRAVDTFEKLVRSDPACAGPYVEDIVTVLTRSDQPSVQWHVAQLFDVIELTAAQRETAVAWLTARVATTDVDWIVATQAMTTLLGFARRGVVASENLRPLLEVQAGHRSAAVRRKAAAFLAALPDGG